MLDQIAETPGIEGIMMIFDDFIVGIEQFGLQAITPGQFLALLGDNS